MNLFHVQPLRSHKNDTYAALVASNKALAAPKISCLVDKVQLGHTGNPIGEDEVVTGPDSCSNNERGTLPVLIASTVIESINADKIRKDIVIVKRINN